MQEVRHYVTGLVKYKGELAEKLKLARQAVGFLSELEDKHCKWTEFKVIEGSEADKLLTGLSTHRITSVMARISKE